jgi:Smg protein
MLSVSPATATRSWGSRRTGLYTAVALAYSPGNVFDVLVYLYENYGALHACPDADSLTKRLTAAGFDDEEISEALAWLSGLEQVTQQSIAVGPESDSAFRIYAKVEVDRLGNEAIGFLSFLEHAGQLTPTQREIVIERALATQEAPVDLEMLKVIVLMVLWSQQADIDVLLLEELLDDGEVRLVH